MDPLQANQDSTRLLTAPFAIVIPLTCVWLTVAITSTPVELASAASETEGLRINPNTASWPDLALLPRIGEVTAQRIIEYRQENKREDGMPVFNRSADLENVRGIGPVTVSRIAPYLEFKAE